MAMDERWQTAFRIRLCNNTNEKQKIWDLECWQKMWTERERERHLNRERERERHYFRDREGWCRHDRHSVSSELANPRAKLLQWKSQQGFSLVLTRTQMKCTERRGSHLGSRAAQRKWCEGHRKLELDIQQERKCFSGTISWGIVWHSIPLKLLFGQRTLLGFWETYYFSNYAHVHIQVGVSKKE